MEGVIIQGAKWISVEDNVRIDKYSILVAGPVNFDNEFARVNITVI